MLAIILALVGAISYGVADFAGGVAARRSHVLCVVAISAPASLVLAAALAPFLGADFDHDALVWGALSGVASAAAFTLLYVTLAIGPMTVLSPVTAVVSAVLPVAVGVLSGEVLSPKAWLGMALAAAAIVLVARGGEEAHSRPSAKGLGLAFVAGVAIAAQLIALHQAPHSSGLAPLIVGRAVASGILLTAALLSWRKLRGKPLAVVPALVAGVLDELANMFFLLGSRSGLLSVTTVIIALYPAATVLLAWLVLRERVARIQQIGLALAAGSVSLLALG
ncbi:MAG: EamA family transporter [Segniliparus sp.]|uniref:EamA family transporter n=1 Tax=Segniliparus sp. TaxID=2804064 RepID=UPI003F407D11